MIMNPDHFQNFYFILFFLNLQHIGNVVNAVASYYEGPGSKSSIWPGPFCVELAFSSHVSVGSL